MLIVDDILKRWGITLTDQLVNDIKTKMIQRRGVNGSFASPVNASGALADSIETGSGFDFPCFAVRCGMVTIVFFELISIP